MIPPLLARFHNFADSVSESELGRSGISDLVTRELGAAGKRYFIASSRKSPVFPRNARTSPDISGQPRSRNFEASGYVYNWKLIARSRGRAWTNRFLITYRKAAYRARVFGQAIRGRRKRWRPRAAVLLLLEPARTGNLPFNSESKPPAAEFPRSKNCLCSLSGFPRSSMFYPPTWTSVAAELKADLPAENFRAYFPCRKTSEQTATRNRPRDHSARRPGVLCFGRLDFIPGAGAAAENSAPRN